MEWIVLLYWKEPWNARNIKQEMGKKEKDQEADPDGDLFFVQETGI